MPKFELLPQSEAEMKSARGKRAETAKEYLGYIGQVSKGQVGKLTPGEGETTAALRRRLGAAAKLAGEELVIRRTGDDIYFWHRAGGPGDLERGKTSQGG